MLLDVLCHVIQEFHFFFFSSRRRHTRSVSAFLLNRSSDLYWSYGSCDPRQQEPYDQYHENSHAKHWDYHKTPLIGRQRRFMIRSEERFSRNAETDLVCRLLLEKESREQKWSPPLLPHHRAIPRRSVRRLHCLRAS